MDDHRFWVAVLALSVSSLGAAIFLQTGRPVWMLATVFGHLELVAIGVHLARTRGRP